MTEEASAPIGVFDSGVGGLSVLIEIKKKLPKEYFLYFADSGHVPYGNKSPEFIRERSLIITNFLISQGAKAIVVACNTASASALKALRSRWPEIPIIGMEPAVKPALALSKNGIVGVLATVGTLKSAQFAALLDKFAAKTKVVVQPAPGLVECVESGDLSSEELKKLVHSFVTPLIEKNADVIVLGCTHYPFLRELISDAAGPAVSLIDTGAAVARQLEKKLSEASLLSSKILSTESRFFTSGEVKQSSNIFSKLLSAPVIVEKGPV